MRPPALIPSAYCVLYGLWSAPQRYPFLAATKIMDSKKRRPDHPEYDPRTLYIPPTYFKVCLCGAARQLVLGLLFKGTLGCCKVGVGSPPLHPLDALPSLTPIHILCTM